MGALSVFSQRLFFKGKQMLVCISPHNKSNYKVLENIKKLVSRPHYCFQTFSIKLCGL